MQEQYLTPAELVKRFKGIVNEKTLTTWRSKGVGPKFTKIGYQILYPIAEVIKWEEQQTIQKAKEKKSV